MQKYRDGTTDKTMHHDKPSHAGPEISIVAPFYNEALNVDQFFSRVLPVLEKLACGYEIICVNDGSRDDTLDRLLKFHEHNPAIKVVSLSRNFGKDIALSSGLDFSSGAVVVPIDADLQDPPELIGEMLEKWREGFDVVYATRRSRQGESWFKRSTAKLFYRLLNKLTGTHVPPNTGDFRLLDRRVVDALKDLPERTRFMKGLFAWVGYKQTSVLYDRDSRHAGSSKWNYWQLWNFALDGITSLSTVPLRIWGYVGIAISVTSFIYAGFLILRILVFGVDVPGYASLMVIILFLGGIQLITLGVIGEYLGRIFNEVKCRPLYLVRETHGFESGGK
ncbi:MAG: glycosyltransferase family 2 protein [Mariprofundaceae bacterium]